MSTRLELLKKYIKELIKKELEEGSYYIERLQENLCEKISKPEFKFKASDLGL